MTIRPTLSFRWFATISSLAAAGLLLATAYQTLIHGGLGDAWLVGLFGLMLVGIAAWSQLAFIRVDESTIVFGPQLLARSSFPRTEVALIRADLLPIDATDALPEIRRF